MGVNDIRGVLGTDFSQAVLRRGHFPRLANTRELTEDTLGSLGSMESQPSYILRVRARISVPRGRHLEGFDMVSPLLPKNMKSAVDIATLQRQRMVEYVKDLHSSLSLFPAALISFLRGARGKNDFPYDIIATISHLGDECLSVIIKHYLKGWT
jgi:hypothetical protein